MLNNALSKFLLLLIALIISACGTSTRPIVQDQSIKKTSPVINQPSMPTNGQTPTAKQSIKKAVTTASAAAPATNAQAIMAPSIVETIKPSDSSARPTNIFNQRTESAPAPDNQSLPQSKQAAIESLLLEVDHEKAQGNTQLAILKLQQGQRIAPNEPKVYARLAEIYLTENNPIRAEQMARKGLTLVGNNKAYLRYFWRVIAACKQRLGDAKGQQQATQMVNRYKNL